jgi:RNA polymerase sigma-70 factor (ECF subfamily)
VESLLHSPDDASEVVTDLFVQLWERRGDVHVQTTLVAYLFGAARNRARNRMRDEQARRRIETQLSVVDALPIGTRERAPDDRVEQDDLAAYALRVLHSLPDPGRTAATLRWMNDLSYQEIGQILEISPGAAQVHVSRVLKVLRTLLPGLTG